MIQSLRKEKGGYALLYVMVVVMVLCAISVMICTVALRNLQSQEASVRRMQDLYAAEGEIERIKAQIETMTPISDTGSTSTEDQDENAAQNKYKAEINSYGTSEDKDVSVDITLPKTLKSGENEVTVLAQKGSTKVTAKLVVNLTINITPESAVEGETPAIDATYSISTNSVAFTSYTIENTGGGS